MKKGLVTILTPCYNGAIYITRLLNSVLAQTYPSIEMIVIDDGSTDNTYEIVKTYMPEFEKRGYSLQCLRQPNGGQSSAINNGLNYVNGEFLTWPDSDDYYSSPEAISLLVDKLMGLADEYGAVRGYINYVADEPSLRILELRKPVDDDSDNLFIDCLTCHKNFYFAAGSYMIRTNDFFKSSLCPIFTHHDTGQNWQLLLPVFYHYKCTTIPKVLFNIVCRNSSHSREEKSYTQKIDRLYLYRQTILETLKRIKNMAAHDLEFYSKSVKINYGLKMFNLALQYNKSKDIEKFYLILKDLGATDNKMRFKRLLSKLHLFNLVASSLRIVRR